MKKLLFLFAFAVIGWMSSLANEATITFADKGYANAEKLTTVVVNEDVTLTFSKGSGSTDPAYYNSGSAARLYGSNTLTISAPGFEITNITFTCGSSNGMGSGFTAAPGELQDGVWTGTASEVVITNGNSSGHARIESIAITYAPLGADVVANPVFAPAAGQVLAGTEVAITCATEGATVYYTTDEIAPTAASTAYTAPIAINDYTIIKAIAIKGENKSDVVTAEYTLIPEVESISAIIDFPDGTKFIVASDLNIVYANGKYVYVKEGRTPALVYGTVDGAEAGKVIKKGWMASYKNYNGLPEILPVDAPEVVEGNGTVIEPLDVEAEDASSFIQAYNVNQYLKLLDVEIEDCSTTPFTGMIGETEVTFYKRFNDVEYPEAAGTYNVTGFVSVYNGNVQFLPASFEAAVEIETPTIESLSALADIPNETPVIVGMPLTVIENSFIFTIVYDGTMYGAVSSTMATFTPGDIIEAGWNATVINGVLMTGPKPTTKAGGIIPEVKEYDAADIASVQYPFSYMELLNVTVDDDIDVFDMGTGVAIALEGDDEASVFIFNGMEDALVAGTCNLTGFWVPGAYLQIEDVDYLFYVTAAEYPAPTIESLSILSDIPNDTPVIVGMPLTVVANASLGFSTITIVYDGTMYGAVASEMAKLYPGDIIEAGWEATVYNGALMTGGSPATVSGGTIPELKVFNAADIQNSQYPFSYLTLADVYTFNDVEAYDMDIAYAYDEETDDWVEVNIYNGLDTTLVEEHYNLTGFWLPLSYFEMGEGYMFWITDTECLTPQITSLSQVGSVENNTKVYVDVPLTVVENTGSYIIVWDGTTYGAVSVWRVQLKPGDVIGAGWYAQTYFGALAAGGSVSITGSEEVPQTHSYEAWAVENTTSAYNYVCYENVSLNSGAESWWFAPASAVSYDGKSNAFFTVYNNNDEDILSSTYNITGFWFPSDVLIGDYGYGNSPEYMFWITNVEEVSKPEPMTMEDVIGNWINTNVNYYKLNDSLEWYSYPYTTGSLATITGTEDGVEITNLMGWGETLKGTVDLANRTITIPAQEYDADGYYICGLGIDALNYFLFGSYYVPVDARSESVVLTIDENGMLNMSPAVLSDTADFDTEFGWGSDWADYSYMWAVIPNINTAKAQIYVRGAMNDWAADAAWEMTTEDFTWYSIENVNIKAGEEFKIADAIWGDINYGGQTDMDIEANYETYYVLEYNAGNCTIDKDLTNGTIYFNVYTHEIGFKQGTPTGIDSIEANGSEAEFFNLQGVKVANPKAGDVYIRVVDGKASKVVVK